MIKQLLLACVDMFIYLKQDTLGHLKIIKKIRRKEENIDSEDMALFECSVKREKRAVTDHGKIAEPRPVIHPDLETLSLCAYGCVCPQTNKRTTINT